MKRKGKGQQNEQIELKPEVGTYRKELDLSFFCFRVLLSE